MKYTQLILSRPHLDVSCSLKSPGPQHRYVSEKDCSSRSWSCYLEPMSPLSDCPYFPPNLPHITGDAAKDEGARALATSDDTEALLIQMGYRAYVPRERHAQFRQFGFRVLCHDANSCGLLAICAYDLI